MGLIKTGYGYKCSLKALSSYYNRETGPCFYKICSSDIKIHFFVKSFKLAEFLSELTKFWEINGRGPLKNIGNSDDSAVHTGPN